MSSFIVLASFTDQGISKIQETVKRANAFKELAKSKGVTVKDIYWTLGPHDIVATLEASDDHVVTALGLALGKSGNVRTQTLKAFTEADMIEILDKVD